MRTIAIGCIVLGLGELCAAEEATEPVADFAKVAVREVNRADGIDALEAKSLASDYYLEIYGVACGGVDVREETDGAWIISTVFGYAATSGSDIIVRKDGTRVMRSGGPDMEFRDGHWIYDRSKNPNREFEEFLAKFRSKKMLTNQSRQLRPVLRTDLRVSL